MKLTNKAVSDELMSTSLITTWCQNVIMLVFQCCLESC